ncbi:MAG: cob(I)yrinic acid a,c-diamide adenosyltransferase [Candidatus Hodarchaeota archaeon]
MVDDGQSHPLGLIHIISGDGKGKTTSALGMALRAAGHGFKTLIIQFMKKGWSYGELETAKLIPNIEIIQFGTPEFVDKNNPKPIDVEEAKKGLGRSKDAMKEGWDIIVLDEINIVLEWNLIQLSEIISLVKSKPQNLELILTGRYAHPELVELADYYTKIESIKHPFQKQQLARKGIEY